MLGLRKLLSLVDGIQKPGSSSRLEGHCCGSRDISSLIGVHTSFRCSWNIWVLQDSTSIAGAAYVVEVSARLNPTKSKMVVATPRCHWSNLKQCDFLIGEL